MLKKTILKVNKEEVDLRLDRFLVNNGLTYSLAQKLIRKKSIKVNKNNSTISYRLQLNDEVEILSDVNLQRKVRSFKSVSPKIIQEIKDSIIFKDQNIIAFNKKSGVAVQSGSKIATSIDDILPHLRFENKENPKLVHRIDKDTSGVLIIARNRKVAGLLSEAFKNKIVQKTYLALVKGTPSQESGVIDIPLLKKYKGKNEKIYADFINGKKAVTEYKILQKYEKQNCALLELKPITGRTHQIRVHLKEIGHPIIGDFKYGSKNTDFKNLGIEKRLYLHALKIKFTDFFGKVLEVSTEKKLGQKLYKFNDLNNIIF